MNGSLSVDDDKIRTIDFSRHGLHLGVELPGYDVPWLALDESDLRILAGLLTRQLPGIVLTPATNSEGLRLLAAWAEAGADWLRRNAP